MDILEVGHGNGLGASSLTIGDQSFNLSQLKSLKNLKNKT